MLPTIPKTWARVRSSVTDEWSKELGGFWDTATGPQRRKSSAGQSAARRDGSDLWHRLRDLADG
eukprot:5126594-Pyramimonas_sp.AAC.1